MSVLKTQVFILQTAELGLGLWQQASKLATAEPVESFAECVSGDDSIGTSHSPEKPIVMPETTAFFISVRNLS